MKRRCVIIIAYFLIFSSFLTSAQGETGATGKGSFTDLTKFGIEDLMKIEVATVVSASKYKQKVTEAPSSVSIITSDEIKQYGYRTLADILRSLRGFFVTSDRNYNYIGARGFSRPGDYNTRFLILLDGHRLNDNIYDQAYIGTEFIIDVDLIDRVEIIRGPSSSLYGTNAFFGVINVITKEGKDVKGPEISGEAGSLGTYKGRISYGHQFKNNFEMLLSGSYYDSKGEERLYYKEFDTSATHYGVAENADSDRSYSFFSKFSFHGFSLEGAHISREKVVPTASFGTVFNDPRNRTIDEYSFLNLKYEYNSEGHLEFMGRLYYGRYHYQGDYIFDYAASGNPADYTLLKDLSWGDWWGTEVQVSKLFLEKYKVIIGGEYRDNFRQDQETYDETPYFKYLDDRRNSKIWAFYMQAEIPLFSTLRLNAGLRYDHYETFGGTTNPRVALIYNPLQNTFIKFLYGSAFRAPNVFELYYQDGGASTKSNPNLKPEKINTYEVVLEQYIGKYFKFSTAGYYYKIEDLISQEIDPEDGLMIYRNLEQIEAKGLEFELEGKWPNLLEGRISYSYQENENKQTGSILTNSPRHMVKLNLTVPLIQRKLFAGLESQYMSIRKTLAGNEAESFFVTNLTLFSKNLVKGLEASASVYNIFDHKYRDPGSSEHLQDLLQQDGRAFRFKLTYKF